MTGKKTDHVVRGYAQGVRAERARIKTQVDKLLDLERTMRRSQTPGVSLLAGSLLAIIRELEP